MKLSIGIDKKCLERLKKQGPEVMDVLGTEVEIYWSETPLEKGQRLGFRCFIEVTEP